MSGLSKLAASAAVVAGLLFASSAAIAADPPGHGGMPPHGFRGAPSGFHGVLPGGGGGPAPGRFAIGRPGNDLGRFNGHTFSGLTPGERGAWQQGGWRHVEHNGYLGWWWVVGDSWFFYPAPIYPYPLYIGPDYYYNYYDYYSTPTYYWYYCEDPAGYYPTVQECNGPWEPVPPQE